jgi:hypothetical protein
MPRTKQVAQKSARTFHDIVEDDAELRALRAQISKLDKDRDKNGKLAESATLELCKIGREAAKARNEYAARLNHLEYKVDVDANPGDVYHVVYCERYEVVATIKCVTYAAAAEAYEDYRRKAGLTDVEEDHDRDCTSFVPQGAVVLRFAEDEGEDTEVDDGVLLVLARVPQVVHDQLQSEQSVQVAN